jgi:hypothetical protein
LSFFPAIDTIAGLILGIDTTEASLSLLFDDWLSAISYLQREPYGYE